MLNRQPFTPSSLSQLMQQQSKMQLYTLMELQVLQVSMLEDGGAYVLLFIQPQMTSAIHLLVLPSACAQKSMSNQMNSLHLLLAALLHWTKILEFIQLELVRFLGELWQNQFFQLSESTFKRLLVHFSSAQGKPLDVRPQYML